MKRFLILMLSIVASCGLAVADSEVAINFSQLPQKAQSFITTHFSQAEVSRVLKDQEDGDYDVYFNNGVKIEFTYNGEWESVNGFDITTSFAPKALQNYLAQKHAAAKVVKIDRDFGDNEIEVKLNNGIEAVFDLNGNFKYYDR